MHLADKGNVMTVMVGYLPVPGIGFVEVTENMLKAISDSPVANGAPDGLQLGVNEKGEEVYRMDVVNYTAADGILIADKVVELNQTSEPSFLSCQE